MQNRGISRLAALVGLLAVAVALTGCTPKSLMGVREHEEGLAFVGCESISVQTIEVWVSPADSAQYDYTLVWKSVGDAAFEPGDVVLYGEDLAGMTTEVGPLPLELQGNVVAISLQHLDDAGQLEVEVQGQFEGDRISSDDWLDESGGHAADACK